MAILSEAYRTLDSISVHCRWLIHKDDCEKHQTHCHNDGVNDFMTNYQVRRLFFSMGCVNNCLNPLLYRMIGFDCWRWVIKISIFCNLLIIYFLEAARSPPKQHHHQRWSAHKQVAQVYQVESAF